MGDVPGQCAGAGQRLPGATLTAALVGDPRLKLVAALNVLGGWLILPWIAAMLLALKRDDLAAGS